MVVFDWVENTQRGGEMKAPVPLDGNRGRLDEYIIPNGIEKGAIQLDRVSGINPEF